MKKITINLDMNHKEGRVSVSSYNNKKTTVLSRVWSCKVSKGVMREQEFLVSHPCET